MAEEAGIERGMGDVIEIPGVTERDLRIAAMDAAEARANELQEPRPPNLKPGEFTRRDWKERERAKDSNISESTVSRDLEKMVALGTLAKADRHDPRYGGRRVIGYWFVE